MAGYFNRVNERTPTRFWINNPTGEEMERAIAASALSCTTNPAYCARLLQAEPGFMQSLLKRAVQEEPDDEDAADRVYFLAAARLADRFLPLYEQNGGTQGFVTVQDDPRKEEDPDRIIDIALRCRELGPNYMAKIPVIASGLKAMETLIAENVPICATEVFSIDQAIQVCELYQTVSERTGNRPPFYVTHITGIFDEYLARVVEQDGIPIAPDVLAWAGSAVGRKEYRLLKERGYETTLLGGGARSIRHFTDFVGGDVHITINWSAAQELLETDPPVESRIALETPTSILEELRTKLPDFRRAYDADALPVEAFADYGPVRHFRDKFIVGYESLVSAVAACRTSVSSETGGQSHV